MTGAENQTSRPFNFIERQKENAVAEIRERNADRKRVAAIVLGDNYRGRRHVTEVINLGGDYLVAVTERNPAGEDVTTWTTVVGDKRTHDHHHRQDEAILHLVARRHDNSGSDSVSAAYYAGRILGLPTT